MGVSELDVGVDIKKMDYIFTKTPNLTENIHKRGKYGEEESDNDLGLVSDDFTDIGERFGYSWKLENDDNGNFEEMSDGVRELENDDNGSFEEMFDDWRELENDDIESFEEISDDD
jgi:hypothetical protein